MSGALTLPGVDVAARPRGHLPTEESERQKALGQFFTPPWLAAEVASIARCRGRVVLEPSAGNGRIVDACLDAGAARVVAVEFDPRFVAVLREKYEGRPVHVIGADFLELARVGSQVKAEHEERWRIAECESIVGNIPYTDGMDTAHLAAIADLVCAGDVMATLLCRTWALHSKERWDGDGGKRGPGTWSRVALLESCPVVDRVPFEIADQGADEGGMIDVSVFRFVDRRRAVGAARWLRPPEGQR